MFEITVDDRKIQAEKGLTIMQALEAVGLSVPHFCYHKALRISGGCRMCLVEVEGMNELVTSCSFKIYDNMVIRTKSDKVTAARRNVLEMLLTNHPLECPTCDKAGECRLQDYAYKYGNSHGSYYFDKRQREELDLGGVIKTNMKMCILCTRCVRFMEKVAGERVLGVLENGSKSRIVNSGPIKSEYAGCLEDICPTGALQIRQNAGKFKAWELQSFETIDIIDEKMPDIYVDVKDNEVARIRVKDDQWITDKSRFFPFEYKQSRITHPFINSQSANYEDAFAVIASKLGNAIRPAFAAGRLTDNESKKAFDILFSSLGHNPDKFDIYGADVIILLNNDDVHVSSGAFKVYLGYCFGSGAKGANVVLPAPTYLEKEATYINAEGKERRTKKVIRTGYMSKPEIAAEILKRVRALPEGGA